MLLCCVAFANMVTAAREGWIITTTTTTITTIT